MLVTQNSRFGVSVEEREGNDLILNFCWTILPKKPCFLIIHLLEGFFLWHHIRVCVPPHHFLNGFMRTPGQFDVVVYSQGRRRGPGKVCDSDWNTKFSHNFAYYCTFFADFFLYLASSHLLPLRRPKATAGIGSPTFHHLLAFCQISKYFPNLIEYLRFPRLTRMIWGRYGDKRVGNKDLLENAGRILLRQNIYYKYLGFLMTRNIM